jgi:GAF domain-containing protein
MQLAPLAGNETERLAQVQALGILDTAPEERFDALTRSAVKRYKVPISTISIIDEDREWYKSCQGITAQEGDRGTSFCGHAMFSPIVFIVEDTLLDPRFADNPAVTGPQGIRFYAGVALHEHASHEPIGVFCIKDTKPRVFNAADVADLIEFGKKAEAELNKKAL